MNTNTKKTPGQILFESMGMLTICKWDACSPEYLKHLEAAALAVLASQWIPVTEPPEDKTKPVIVIGGRTPDPVIIPFESRDELRRTHWAEIPPFVEPIDPYAELRQAFGAGKVIQRKHTIYDQWVDLDKDRAKLYFEDEYSRDELRIKPWELSHHLPGFRALEPGEEWHRNDFTEAMLPEGWRPLLLGELAEKGDQSHGNPHVITGNCWYSYFVSQSPCFTYNRTRRPLPPTKLEQEQKEFEQVAEDNNFSTAKDHNGNYHEYTHHFYLGWKAAKSTKEKK